MTAPAVLLEGVTKRFAGHVAVRDLSMTVPTGGIFGLLGPNGAGKSTTIRMIMEIYLADEGRIEILGTPHGARALSDRLGYIPEERGLYKKMKVIDQLIFFGETKGIVRGEARKRGLAWIERLGLGEWRDKKVEDLSKGMQQKVQFAGALLHDPDLVVLDEPFSGLDPVNSQVMKDVVIDIAKQGRTVLFSTHIMEQAERMCDRVVIIARGEKVVDGTLAEIKHQFGGTHVALTFSRDKEKAARVLADRSLVASVDDYGVTADVELASGAQAESLLEALVHAGVGMTRFELVEPSLQSIFIAKVGAEAVTAARKEEVAA
ncbi:MAG TPA: ATP-binding cassette domain-containing protein [Gemmatimonadales bacterium]|nr:ATP-binding cassette domain-containing protein [Gemmatimonadales bacterium]